MEIFNGVYQFNRMANYFLVDGDEMVLIDTGMPGGSSELINHVQNTLKKDIKDIKTIIITHHDFDHIGNLPKFKKITGAKVAAHKDAADYISGKKEDETKPLFLRIFQKLFEIILRPEKIEIDILLEDNDQIGNYRVIHTPGHTVGSICLYDEKNKILFAGDSLSYKNEKIEDPIAIFTQNMGQAQKSLKKLGFLDIKTIFTGHSKPVTSNASEKLNEYLRNSSK